MSPCDLLVRIQVPTLSTFFFFFFAFLTPSTLTKVIDVFPSSPGGISAAINASSPQDSLYFHAGTYFGKQNCDLQIQTQNLLLIGVDGPQNTIIDCGLASRCICVLGVNTTIIGITFKNGRAPNTPTTTTTTSTNNGFRDHDDVSTSTLSVLGSINFSHQQQDRRIRNVIV